MTLDTLDNQLLLKLCDIFLEYMCCSVSITGGDGLFILANKECEQHYGFTAADYSGKPVILMEKHGIFKPSIAAIVLQQKIKVAGVQPDRFGVFKPITGIPVFNRRGEIAFVVCFSSWKVKTFEELQDKYEQLEVCFHQCAAEMRELKGKAHPFPMVTSSNRQMTALIGMLTQIAPYDASVIFHGEPGVGKSFYARFLHSMRHQGSAPFVEINCAVIPHNIIETELFGKIRHKEKENSLRNGTLLLKEIDALPLNVQSDLVIAMREKEDNCSGDLQEKPRLIATTDKDLALLTAKGLFREELYYLLNTIPIAIPPLKERPEDILAFIMHFMEKKNQEYGLHKTLSRQAMNKLLLHSWPGNIREVQSLIGRLLLTTSDDVIQSHQLPNSISDIGLNPEEGIHFSLKEALEFHEKRLVLHAYEKHKTTVALARALGISQPSAVRKLAKYRERPSK